MLSKHYVFHNAKIISYSWWADIPRTKLKGGFFYSPSDDCQYRWGEFTERDEHGWVGLPVEAMPKEFRIQLLLLGVSC